MLNKAEAISSAYIICNAWTVLIKKQLDNYFMRTEHIWVRIHVDKV